MSSSIFNRFRLLNLSQQTTKIPTHISMSYQTNYDDFYRHFIEHFHSLFTDPMVLTIKNILASLLVASLDVYLMQSTEQSNKQ